MRLLFTKLLLSTVALGAALGLPVASWAQQQSPLSYGSHMWNGGWYGWFFGPMMMIAFIAVAVVVVVVLVRWLRGRAYGSSAPPGLPGNTPLDILKERFARGEIDKEEFEERRKLLGE